ncbi:MAG: hypothetical protein V1776_04315 [Candidatus Diapherotrites archaeon]
MQPIQKFVAGAIVASVWKNTSDKGAEFLSVSLQKRYKDDKGEWQSSSSYKPGDLPKASLVLNKAYEYIVLHGGSAESAMA